MTHPVSPEVAKELAEALRNATCACSEIAWGTRGETSTLTCPRCAALAKFDAEQGKAEEMAWTEREIKLIRHAISLLSGYAHNAANHYAQKGPQSNLEYMKSAIEDARTLDNILVRLNQAIAPVPAPSAVRAPAVVAAQGVTEAEALELGAVIGPGTLNDLATYLRTEPSADVHDRYGSYLAKVLWCADQLDKYAQAFAATRAQQGGDAEHWTDKQWLRFLSVAFRHVQIVGDIVFDELRQGAAIAAKEGEGND